MITRIIKARGLRTLIGEFIVAGALIFGGVLSPGILQLIFGS